MESSSTLVLQTRVARKERAKKSERRRWVRGWGKEGVGWDERVQYSLRSPNL
jgi:hypothetical protein